MDLKKILIDCYIIGLVILACLFVYKQQTNPSPIQGPFTVRSIQVIQGNEFDIIYDTGRVHGKLIVTTPPEAKLAVTRLFNDITNPKVYFLKQDKDFWYVKITVLKDGKEIDKLFHAGRFWLLLTTTL